MTSLSIFCQFIEKLVDSELSYDDRAIVYQSLIDVLEDFDVKNIEECLDIDRAFDTIWYEKYPELENDDD